MVMSFFVSLIVSLICGGILLRSRNHHQSFTSDNAGGPQKNHTNNAIRVGGVPIMVGWSIGLCVAYYRLNHLDYLLIFVTTLPVFIAGLVEDITKKVSPRVRLLFAFLSASVAIFFFNSLIRSVDFAVIDNFVLIHTLISFALTLLAVGGATHSFNIIDGHNGLSGMVSILILAGISYVAFKVHDFQIASIAFALMGAIGGFLFWNFPKGHIFAGDCGAYLMGFVSSQLAILLVSRHKDISPWFAFLLLLYPVFETLFSMYRRKYIQYKPIARPDSLHLHSIIYKRMVRWVVGRDTSADKIHGNSMTSPYLWIISLNTIVPAFLFWNNKYILIAFALQYIVTYVWLYRRIVRFRTPKILAVYKYRNYLEPKNK